MRFLKIGQKQTIQLKICLPKSKPPSDWLTSKTPNPDWLTSEVFDGSSSMTSFSDKSFSISWNISAASSFPDSLLEKKKVSFRLVYQRWEFIKEKKIFLFFLVEILFTFLSSFFFVESVFFLFSLNFSFINSYLSFTAHPLVYTSINLSSFTRFTILKFRTKQYRSMGLSLSMPPRF